ncbi:S41 family peptidase [Deinococcus aquiradiocola]|uniref:Protease n=1 Tax=Deinococcus aquiradiocola TaxID=393059 RepID=A0A917PNG9_9DEIO|nr:S41 family peptidase [Deinococcus aquiradiocola]GGJ85461.1 protease [Deinococcus aquiradiocola]
MTRPHKKLVALAAMSALTLSATSCTLAAGSIQTRGGVSGTTAPSGRSPAQRLFNQVNALLSSQYGGLSTVDRVKLARDYQLKLDAACQKDGADCARDAAYPVLEAEIDALGDEHSFFERPDEYQSFVAEATGGTRLQFGVRLAKLDGESRVVTSVIPGSAAADADLRRGDVLRTLGSQPYTYDALKKAKEAGTPTVLGVQRGQAQISVTLTSRESTTRDLPRMTRVGTVDVIAIPTFLAGGGVADRVHELVAQANRDQATGIVVDLRGNTGGNLFECDEAASAFVPNFSRLSRSESGDTRTVVSMGTRLEDGQRRDAVQMPAFWTGPLAVVVDQASASCSEFFAFEVQYARRGPIVGEATAGVGNTATQVFPLGDAALQLTVINYVKPDGTPYPTQVKPDVPGKDDISRLAQGEDVLLNAALTALRDAPQAASPGALQPLAPDSTRNK